jgi:hypothetical protein
VLTFDNIGTTVRFFLLATSSPLFFVTFLISLMLDTVELTYIILQC